MTFLLVLIAMSVNEEKSLPVNLSGYMCIGLQFLVGCCCLSGKPRRQDRVLDRGER
jgi:hypothetical protein